MPSNGFLSGVVEGFYGRPWTQSQRLELFARMADWGMNTYFYAPKDDLKHRAIWRECYEPAELASLGSLINACEGRRLSFVYGLSPGLDIRFADSSEVEKLQQRLTQLLEIGCRYFALLFDDLPGDLSPADKRAFSTVAAAQSSVANEIYEWLRTQSPQPLFFFCPTAYCDRMDQWQLGGEGYLQEIGDSLDPGIQILWTGPEIVSQKIDVESIERLADRVGRAPLIWDNLFANDYDQCRLYCGPYTGRPIELCEHVAGILINPNNEYPINYIPFQTFADYLHGEAGWNPRAAFVSAAEKWLDGYKTVNQQLVLDDLILLADCYYLPFEEGPEAARLFVLIADLVDQPANSWGRKYDEFLELNRRIQSMFDRLTELCDRELFYAWSRRAWDLKEELLLFADYLAWKKSADPECDMFHSESHMHGTYRGGLVAKLRRLLEMHEHNVFIPGPSHTPR